MIRVDAGEQFSIMATLVDEGSMGEGLSVYYSIKSSAGMVIDSGGLTEDTTYSGIYSKYVTINVVGNYKVFYGSVDYASGAEEVIVTEESLAKLIKQVRQHNMSMENVLATVNIPARNVAIGKTNYVIIKVKNDSDVDWSSPISERRVYSHYRNMGDDQPYYMGEE